MSRLWSPIRTLLQLPPLIRTAVALLVMAAVGIVGDGLWRSYQSQELLTDTSLRAGRQSSILPLRDTIQQIVRLAITASTADDGRKLLDRLADYFMIGTRQVERVVAERTGPGGDTSATAADTELLKRRLSQLVAEAETIILVRSQATREVAAARAGALTQTASAFNLTLAEWLDRNENAHWRQTASQFRNVTTIFHWTGLLAIGLAVCGLRALHEANMRRSGGPETLRIPDANPRGAHDHSMALESAQDFPIALLTLDCHGSIVWLNSEALRYFEVTSAEIVGRSLGEFCETRTDAETLIKRFHAGEPARAVRIPIRLRDGRTRSTLLEATLVTSDGVFHSAHCTLRQITSDMRIGESLGMNERRLRALVIDSPSGVFLTDTEGNCTFLNERGCELLGVSFERASMRGWVGAVHPEDRVAVVDEWQRCVETQWEFQKEFRYLRPDGSIVWVAGRAAPLRDEWGRVTEFMGTITEVTRLKEAEEAYRESNRRFRAMADTAPVMIWKRDPQGEITFLNRQWLEFRGRTFDEECTENWLDAVLPEDREPLRLAAEAAAADRKEYKSSYRLRRHDGVYRWMLQTAVPRAHSDGTFLGFIATCVDITDQKDVEERIRLSEERFAMALRGSTDTLFDWDLTTGQIYQSPRMAETLGYDPVEAETNLDWFLDALHPEDRERLWKAVQDHVQHEMPFDVDYRMRTRTGELRWFHSRGLAVRNTENTAVRLAGSTIDITLQREQHETVMRHAAEAEQARQQIEMQADTLAQQAAELHAANEKAMAAARSKGEFLANMSHEIRTPLNVILGMADLALNTPLSDDQRDLLQNVRTSGEHLLTLIGDILDFSKIEAGKLTLEEIDFSLAECVYQSIQLFAISARNKGLELRIDIKPTVPAIVRGDEHRLRQILINLVGNAVKFTPSGSITTTLATCGAGRTASTMRLRLTVADTGIGISELQKKSIFKPFEQGDGSRTRQYGGTGLGLSIVRRLAEMMNGKTWVESRLQQGSQFHVEFEVGCASGAVVATEPAVAPARTPSEGRGMPSLRVLVAEDNNMNQNLVLRILKTAGHEVTVVSDGAAAVSAVARTPFDLLLMDMQMPVVGGLEATSVIREAERRSQRRRIPIVALTANAMRGDREQCLASGMDGYVPKPIRRDDLFAEMERVWREQNSMLESGLSVDSLMDRVENDGQLLADMVQLLDEMAPALISGLVAAGREGRVTDVRHFAHKLRGTVGVFGPSMALASFERIEDRARATPPEFDLPAIERAHSQFEMLRGDLVGLVAAIPHEAA
jgi:PAS domain S-box-containing protein